MQTTPLRPRVDPYRFQSLDKLVVRRKWLPTVHQCRSHHNTGFPSDHYLLAASLQVKLGARPPAAPRPPKLEYQVGENTRQQFCQTFRSAYVRPRTDTPVPTRTDQAPKVAPQRPLQQAGESTFNRAIQKLSVTVE